MFTPYEPLISSVAQGDRLLLDDGHIELRVSGRTDDEIETVVVHGGLLGEHKGINAPGVRLPSGALTAKDEDDLRFGIGLGVDLVALSFVQTADDVLRARAIADRAGSDVPLIAKIERPEGVTNLDSILAVADGVMVARGDLGLECPLEHVPRIQKEIVRQARARGRPVIVATQVLESMRTEPRPTRAEVSDAATAVDQGVDAIMLAGRDGDRQYPVIAVQTLAAIVCEAERLPPAGPSIPLPLPTAASRHGRALCEAAVTLASTGQAEAIVAMTRERAHRPPAVLPAPAGAGPCGDALTGGGQPAGAALGSYAGRVVRAGSAQSCLDADCDGRPLAQSGRRVRQREPRRQTGRRELSQRSTARHLSGA